MTTFPTSDDMTRYEWANLTGNYADVNDYERMCVLCHRRFDANRRHMARDAEVAQ